MPDEGLKTLQERLGNELGREIPLEQIARNKERLERVLAFSQIISAWESRLDLIEPANVSALLRESKA